MSAAAMSLLLLSLVLSSGFAEEASPPSEAYAGAGPSPAAATGDDALRPRIIPVAPSAYESVPGQSLTMWVAKINGEPISVREFERRVLRNRAAAATYFAQKHQAQDSAEFWTTSFDGEVPSQWVRKKALEECVKIKIEQILARDKGLLQDIGYAAFLQKLDRENERRRKALAAGEPIYGPQQYGEDEFFTYVHNNMLIELKRRLGQHELLPTEEELQVRYQADKDKLYDRGYRIRIWEIEVSYLQREGEPKPLTREAAKAKIEEARVRLDKKERFEEVAPDYNEDKTLLERTMDENSQRTDLNRTPEAREQALKLEEGQASPVFEENDACHILFCLEKDKLGYRPFEEVKPNVAANCVEDKYQALVAGLVAKAKVEINRPVYENTQVR